MPEIEKEDKELRHELLTLLQSLELIGITPIVVEEAGAHSEAWLPFVVDIVFEIELWSEPDTGYLLRKLKCPKSRYGQALPGPHDYGLDVQKPSLWPDLEFTGSSSLVRSYHIPPDIFIPIPKDYAVCRPGSVVVSEYGKSPSVLGAFLGAPGISHAWLWCGPVSKIRFFTERGLLVDENEGVFSIAWSLIRGHRDGEYNSVVIEDFDYFLSRPRLRARALRMIMLLSAAGLSVCLHGRDGSLGEAVSIADLMIPAKISGFVKRKESIKICRADRWLGLFEQKETATPDVSIASVSLALIFDNVQTPAVLLLDRIRSLPGNTTGHSLIRASAYHLAGSFAAASQELSAVRAKDAAAAFARASFLTFTGDGLEAARECLPWHEHLGFHEIWNEIAIVYTQNKAMVDAYTQNASQLPLRKLIVLLRALARSGQVQPQFVSVVESCSKRFVLPDWYRGRLQAEAYFDVENHGFWRFGIQELESLVGDEAVPAIHRAEISYNLGVAKSRLGDEPGAREAYKRALEFNELLEPAANALG